MPPQTLATAESTALLSSLASHGAGTVHTILAAADPAWARESAVSAVHPRGIRVTYSEHGAALSFHVRGGMTSGQPGLGQVHLPYSVNHEVVAHVAAALAARG